jgi:hypothetical protein
MTDILGAVIFDHDRRETKRQAVNAGALSFVKDRPDAICCIVKDLSEQGAKITLVDEICFLPKNFRMHIPEKHIMAHCEQVWRKGREIGLKFSSLADIG